MVMMAPVSPAAFSTASLSRGLMVAMSSTRTPIPCSFRMAARVQRLLQQDAGDDHSHVAAVVHHGVGLAPLELVGGGVIQVGNRVAVQTDVQGAGEIHRRMGQGRAATASAGCTRSYWGRSA